MGCLRLPRGRGDGYRVDVQYNVKFPRFLFTYSTITHCNTHHNASRVFLSTTYMHTHTTPSTHIPGVVPHCLVRVVRTIIQSILALLRTCLCTMPTPPIVHAIMVSIAVVVCSPIMSPIMVVVVVITGTSAVISAVVVVVVTIGCPAHSEKDVVVIMMLTVMVWSGCSYACAIHGIQYTENHITHP